MEPKAAADSLTGKGQGADAPAQPPSEVIGSTSVNGEKRAAKESDDWNVFSAPSAEELDALQEEYPHLKIRESLDHFRDRCQKLHPGTTMGINFLRSCLQEDERTRLDEVRKLETARCLEAEKWRKDKGREGTHQGMGRQSRREICCNGSFPRAVERKKEYRRDRQQKPPKRSDDFQEA